MSEDIEVEKLSDGEVFYKNEWVKIRDTKDNKMEVYIDNKWIAIEEIGYENFIEDMQLARIAKLGTA